MLLKTLLVTRPDGSSYSVTPEEYEYPEMASDLLLPEQSGPAISLEQAYNIFVAEVMELDDRAAHLLAENRWVKSIRQMGYQIFLN